MSKTEISNVPQPHWLILSQSHGRCASLGVTQPSLSGLQGTRNLVESIRKPILGKRFQAISCQKRALKRPPTPFKLPLNQDQRPRPFLRLVKASAQELPSATRRRCREVVEELLEKVRERRKDLGVDVCKALSTLVVSVAAPKVAIQEPLGPRRDMGSPRFTTDRHLTTRSVQAYHHNMFTRSSF